MCPEDIPKTLIFTQTKNDACRVYGTLLKHTTDRKYLSMFHASLTQSTKSICASEFRSGSLRCLVSTVAFGMVMMSVGCYPCSIVFQLNLSLL